jgi:hypothetical protein
MSKLKKLLSELKMGGYDIPMGKVVTAKDMPAFKTPSQLKEEEDHEVSMAQSSLDSIIKYATELKAKLGNDEKEIPAWIQDHISKAENFIQQASSQYHEYGEKNESMNEGKNDFVATHSGATITLKNGYKHHSEDKLNSLYDKLGKMVKGLKVKNVQLVFEEKSIKTGK